MIRAFPKIFAIGTDYIRDLFNHPVEITEKLDGSQFAFGKDPEGNFYMRSKGKQIFSELTDKNFIPAVDHALAVQDRVPNNMVFYCETLARPKHNSLKYNNVPKNNLYLFGVSDFMGTKFDSNLQYFADLLDIDRAVVLNDFIEVKIDTFETIREVLNRESYLGGPSIEGIVIKNYYNPFLLGGQPIPLMAGKFVSEAFKEVHRKEWDKETSVGKWTAFKESYRTEARWLKAIEHLRDKNEIDFVPQDIGKLLKEINQDIVDEEKEIIKEFLWKEFGKEVLRRAGAGFPEWYKEYIANRSFEKGDQNVT